MAVPMRASRALKIALRGMMAAGRAGYRVEVDRAVQAEVVAEAAG